MSDSEPVRTLRDGRYALVGVLGAGSQAETLDAVDKRDGRAVAIKHFQVRGAKSWKDVELAEREARVLATLRHASLPEYVEHFEEDGALYLVMGRSRERRWLRCVAARRCFRSRTWRAFWRMRTTCSGTCTHASHRLFIATSSPAT